MAEVSITIRMLNQATITVSGTVDDAALSPFTSQLATLLAAAASAPKPVSSVSSTSSGSSAASGTAV